MITREEVDKLKKYDIIFRHADGVWCSPICMGHFWIVEKVFKKTFQYCWVPDGWEVTRYQSSTMEKEKLINDLAWGLEVVREPYYSFKYMIEQQKQTGKTRYQETLKGNFWCPECANWHSLPLHKITDPNKDHVY
jgi:hypothetical protein